MRKRAREDPCGICNHYHNYEQGEVCPTCGHRLTLSAAVSSSPSPDRPSSSNPSSSHLLTIPGASHLNVELSGKDCASERSTDSIAKRDTSEVALGRRVLSELNVELSGKDCAPERSTDSIAKRNTSELALDRRVLSEFSNTNEVVSDRNNEYVSSPKASSPQATTSSMWSKGEDVILQCRQRYLDRLWDIVSKKLSETSLEHLHLIKQGVDEILEEMGRYTEVSSLKKQLFEYFTCAELYTKWMDQGPWNFLGGKDNELVTITEQESKVTSTLADLEEKVLDLDKERAMVMTLIAKTKGQQLQVQAKKLAIEEEISDLKRQDMKQHVNNLVKLKEALDSDLQEFTSFKLSHSVK